MQYQLLPYERTREFCHDIFQVNLSAGTLNNRIKGTYTNLESFDQKIRKDIPIAPVIHCDETGANINGQLHWMHTASTQKLTVLDIHAKRGISAMLENGILPDFKGIVMHDY